MDAKTIFLTSLRKKHPLSPPGLMPPVPARHLNNVGSSTSEASPSKVKLPAFHTRRLVLHLLAQGAALKPDQLLTGALLFLLLLATRGATLRSGPTLLGKARLLSNAKRKSLLTTDASDVDRCRRKRWRGRSLDDGRRGRRGRRCTRKCINLPFRVDA